MPAGRTKYRVLVIDDDQDVARMIGEMLRRLGYFATVCTKPLDAMIVFARAPERFDAVIVDEMMPEIRGTQVVMRLLRMKDDIPVILVTGHGDKITLDEVQQSGVRATLLKPLLKDQLRNVLSKLLNTEPPRAS